ncbi:MAG: transglycosylase SLT domain-containing protein [Nitrosomonadales bacterium]|nr:transglycosylase SLT domain-containing protein [Nitrosomonadales bacterium]MBT6141500.1 transglycosylase SLT domain-containing protein [Nitrosomonadales bacterium]MDA9088008.1 transglycosylase SLT domain-containing protein [Methylophilaceae bacterium]MDC1281518.1 transglycosylase SLT domain-containing protein [Methylophilaceae bacterium]
MHFKQTVWRFIVFNLINALLATNVYAITNVTGDPIIIIEDDTPENVIISDDIFPAKPAESLWPKINAGYKMYTKPSKKGLKRIKKYENWYKKRPDYIERMMVRANKYLYFVYQEVKKRNMPMEIALLPMIESAYNPLAKSKAKAVGMWQFIPSTGRLYGLQQDWWRDERQNVIESTDSALDYLERLHDEFGTWELALAAYNAGEGRVGRTQKKNKRNKRPTDFYSLNLPMETRNYVPKLLAIRNIMQNPAKYGIELKDIPFQPYFESVVVPDEIDTELAARLAEISLEEFQLLNAEHKRPIMKSVEGAHSILLPVGAVTTFNKNLFAHDQPISSWKVYKPKKGETLKHVAKKFNIDWRVLAKVNQLRSQKRFGKRNILLIPNTNAIGTSFPSSGGIIDYHTIITHRVKSGETLSHISSRYKVGVKAIMEFNELPSSKIIIGDILDIPK